MNLITKEMSIEEAINAHPQIVDVFNKYHMGCFSCMGATAESIESGAKMHGVNVDELLADLNAILKNNGAS